MDTGETLAIDLEEEGALRSELSTAKFQDRITAITVLMHHPTKGGGTVGVQHSITRPEGYSGRVWFEVEPVSVGGRRKGGEKVHVFFADTRLTLMAHRSQPAVRITTTRIGVRKHMPQQEVLI